MKKNIITKISIITVLLLPSVSYAALTGLKGLLTSFGGLINQAITILFGLTLIFFFWGLGQFVLHSGDQKARDDGKKKMLWGIVALFVFISIYGILAFIGNIFGIGLSGTYTPTNTQVEVVCTNDPGNPCP